MSNTKSNPSLINQDFVNQIKYLLQSAKQKVVRQVNQTMVYTYFEIGKMIVEEEQRGKERAEYGKNLLKDLSKELTREFGKGFSVDNLERMRKFYRIYANRISASLMRISDDGENSASSVRKTKNGSKSKIDLQLSWTHYLKLMQIDNKDEMQFYELEAINNNWSVRELKRQCNSALYQRLVLSRDKKAVTELSEKGQVVAKPEDSIKDPYILEFVGLPEHSSYSESDLEQKLIDKLEHFLLELGKGFTFVARQKRISFDDRHFRVDLVFYNRILKCFVLIDLKIGDVRHQDLGQMQMYVNYYDRYVRLDDENKTIGIILSRYKSNTLVEITLPEDNKQIFASKYKTVLPSKEELKKLIEEKNG